MHNSFGGKNYYGAWNQNQLTLEVSGIATEVAAVNLFAKDSTAGNLSGFIVQERQRLLLWQDEVSDLRVYNLAETPR